MIDADYASRRRKSVDHSVLDQRDVEPAIFKVAVFRQSKNKMFEVVHNQRVIKMGGLGPDCTQKSLAKRVLIGQ